MSKCIKPNQQRIELNQKQHTSHQHLIKINEHLSKSYQNRWTSNKNLITINHNVLNSMSIFGNSWKSYHNHNQTKSNQYLSKSVKIFQTVSKSINT